MIKKRASITRRDIQNGRAGRCSECPGALAINRLLKNDWISAVYSSGVCYYQLEEIDPDWYKFRSRIKNCISDIGDLPGRLLDFIQDFDNDLNPAPVRFTIEIPEEVLRNP